MCPSRPSRKPTTEPAQRFFHRHISWLEFNRRVLAQAADPATPLLERVRFLAIFTSNLDEFFTKRVGLIKRQVHAGLDVRSADGLTPRQQLGAIRPRAIVALGKFAAQALLRTDASISTLRGHFDEYQGIPLMPTYHPAYLLRTPTAKRMVWDDLQLVMKHLADLGV